MGSYPPKTLLWYIHYRLCHITKYGMAHYWCIGFIPLGCAFRDAAFGEPEDQEAVRVVHESAAA